MELQDFINLGGGTSVPSAEGDVKKPSVPDAYTKSEIDGKITALRVSHDATYVGLLKSDGSWAMHTDDTGSLWCAQLGDINTRIETRAQAWANDRVAGMSFRRVSEGYSSQPGSTRQNYTTPAGTVLCGLDTGSATLYGFNYIYLQLYDPVRGWYTMGG